jgi:hypothetical protein
VAISGRSRQERAAPNFSWSASASKRGLLYAADYSVFGPREAVPCRQSWQASLRFDSNGVRLPVARYNMHPRVPNLTAYFAAKLRVCGVGLGASLLMMSSACAAPPRAIEVSSAYPAPSPSDRGELCTDVAGARACWNGAARFPRPRALPAGPAPPGGWRCTGMGNARSCEDRRRNGSAFACAGPRCVQARPRMPDDGEWECVEMAGVVFCHSRGDAAGIAPGAADSGWLCGLRRGGASAERVCVDFAPDRPNERERFVCAFEYARGQAQRVCTRAQTPSVGSACDAAHGCPAGAACSEGVCLPPRPSPACWFDQDCAAGSSCRWGTCGAGGPPA